MKFFDLKAGDKNVTANYSIGADTSLDYSVASGWTVSPIDGFAIVKGTGWIVSQKAENGVYNTPFTCIKKATLEGTKIKVFNGGRFGVYNTGANVELPFKRQSGTLINTYKAEDLYILDGTGEVTISSGNLVDDRYIEDADRRNDLIWSDYHLFYKDFHLGRRPGEVMQQVFSTAKYFVPSANNGGYFKRARFSNDLDDSTYRYSNSYGSISEIGTIKWIQGATNYMAYPLYGWNCFLSAPMYTGLSYYNITTAKLDEEDESRIVHINYPQYNRGFYLLPYEKYYPNKRISITEETPICLRYTDSIWQSAGTPVDPQPLKKNLLHYPEDYDILCPSTGYNDYYRCWNNIGYNYPYRTIYRRTKYTPETYNYTTQSVNPASIAREYFVVFSTSSSIPTINYSTYYNTTYIRRAYEYAARVYWFTNIDDRINMPVQVSNNTSRWYLDIQGRMSSTQYLDTEIVWSNKSYTLASEQYVSAGFTGITCRPIQTGNQDIQYEYRLEASDYPVAVPTVAIVDKNILKLSFTEPITNLSINENEAFSIKTDRISYAGNEQEIAYTTYDLSDDQYDKSLLHFNGANGSKIFIDITGKIWTAYGNAIISSPGGQFAASSFLQTPNHTDFTLANSDYTIDFWINQTSRTRFSVFESKLDDNNVYRIISSGYNWAVEYILNGVHINTMVCLNADILNGWHHVAIVRSGSNMFFFLDGISKTLNEPTNGFGGEGDTWDDPIGTGYYTVYSGIGNTSIINFDINKTLFNNFVGMVDEFRFSIGIARWTANFTPPTAFNQYIALGDYLIGSTYDFYHKISYFKVNNNDLYVYLCDAIDTLRADKKLYITYDSSSGSLYTNSYRIGSFSLELDTTTQQQVVPSIIENVLVSVTASCTLTWVPS